MAQGPSGGRSRTRIGVARGLAAAAVGLASTLAAAGAAIGTTVAPAHADDPRPTYQGTELKPGPTIQQAPQIGSGTYVADAPTGAVKDSYITINRTIPGSTLWFGGTFDPGPGLSADKASDLQLEAYPDGDSTSDCLFGKNLDTDSADTPRLETVLVQLTKEGDCGTAKSITIGFHPYEVKFPAGTKMQLNVWEEPPVDNVSGLPAGSESVTWADMGPGSSSPTKITPGTTWSNAPDISQGTFSVHLAPGSVNVFRMPLDWGQHAQVTVKPTKAIDEYESIDPFWAGPMGGAIAPPKLLALPPNFAADSFDFFTTDTFASATPVVTYRSRELKGSYGDAPAQVGAPGNYYFVVSVATKGIPKDGIDATMQSGYYTDFAVGAPSYKQPPSVMPQSFTGDDAGDPVGDPVGDGGSSGGSDGPPWPIITMLGGGAAIFAVLGAFVLGRSRKVRA